MDQAATSTLHPPFSASKVYIIFVGLQTLTALSGVIDADAEVEFEAAVEFMDAKMETVAELVDADEMVEVEAIAELVDVGAVGVEVVAESESGLAFFDRPFGCHCDDVFLALSFAFFLLSSSFSFFFYSLSSFLFCFSSVGIQDQCWQQPTSIQKLINISDHETGHVIG